MASRLVIPTVDVGPGIKPASGAKMFFFETGTSTDRDTFSDAGATIKNSNPVIADSNGVFPDIFIDGIYKVRLTDKNGVQTGFGEKDPVGPDTIFSITKKPTDPQTLTANQIEVTFPAINVSNADIFITSLSGDRGRLLEGSQNDYTVKSANTIELTNSFPAGTICFADETLLETATFSESDLIKKFNTLSDAKLSNKLKITDVANITIGGFTSFWDVVSSTSNTANTIDIVEITNDSTILLKLITGSEVNLVVMGASVIGIIDATAIIKRAVVLMKAVRGTVYAPTGVYLHSDTITVDEDNVTFRGDGEGTVQGGIATLRASAATRFLYSNLATPKLFYEFTSVTGDVPKSGGGMSGIMLDCDSTATTALTISSWRKAYFGNLHIYAPTSQGIHVRAFAGTLTSEPYDSQQNHFDNIEIHSKNAANTYVALHMTGGEGDGGANAGNSSFNYFTNCFLKSELATAILLENTDNNYFYQVHAGGSASFFSLVLETNEGTTGNARFNQFHGCEFTGKGVNAKAAQSGGLSSFDNYFFGLSKSNGAPKPTVGAGAGGSADASIIVDGVAEFAFTPTVEGTSAAGTATYSIQIGRLTRAADRVEFELKVGFSSFTGTGDIIIKGLPLVADAAANVGVLSIVAENLTFSNQLVARMIQNTATIELVTISTGAVAASVPVDSAAILTISGAYLTQDNL